MSAETREMNRRPRNKTAQVRESIYRDITIGNFARGSMLPSERVLASSYQVSHMTLRKALQDLTEAGLLESIAGVGTFVRAEIPETLLRRQLGVVIPAWSAPENNDFRQMITEVAAKANWLVRIVYAQSWDDRSILNLWQNSDALLISPVQALDELPPGLFEKILSGRKPVLLSDDVSDERLPLDTVTTRFEPALAQLAERLAGRGYTRIVQVEQIVRQPDGSRLLYNPDVSEICRKLHALRMEMELDQQSLFLEIPPFESPYGSFRDRIIELGRALEHSLLVVPLGYYWGVMAGLNRSCRRVPEEVAVLAVGDRREAEFYRPRPTLLQQPRREHVRHYFELLRSRCEQPQLAPRRIPVDARLECGETL